LADIEWIFPAVGVPVPQKGKDTAKHLGYLRLSLSWAFEVWQAEKSQPIRPTAVRRFAGVSADAHADAARYEMTM
jgi:hypothetical protein